MNWICCQPGARENYAVPRALNDLKYLRRLYTDIWYQPRRLLSGFIYHFIPRLSGRYDHNLAHSEVISFTLSALWFEFSQYLMQNQGWQRMYQRNRWFQDRVINCKVFESDCKTDNNRPIVFCYSYAALKILERAREYGCFTVLGQIDGGLEEENIVAHAVTKYPDLQPMFERAPEAYWRDWKQECDLADCIVVNSDWSRQLLDKAGIADRKIKVMPLMYDSRNKITSGKEYPDKFTDQRPLKVLFLGSLIVRKGIGEMLEAVKSLKEQPIEFWFVGQAGVRLPEELRHNSRVHWIGPVLRSETEKYYQMCDIFIFPTLSDGFGLTQLEAMSYGLPVIASKRCGAVVDHNLNGLLLSEVSSEDIYNALVYCKNNSKYLGEWSNNALKKVLDYSSQNVYPQLLDLISP